MEKDTQSQEEEAFDKDEFFSQLKSKISKFFETKSYISSRDELDNFLSELDLLEIWNSEEEKDEVWQCLIKYEKDSKINYESAIKGFNELFNQEEGLDLNNEESSNEILNQKKENKDNKENKETLLTRLSRISLRGSRKISGNNLALNRYKQRARNEYDLLDNNSLIQFKKVFAIVKLNLNNGKISFENLKEKCEKQKLIKYDINIIWKYLSFCVCEENLKNIENKQEFAINNEIMKDLNDFIDQKLMDEDIDINSEDNSEEYSKDYDKKDNLEEQTLDLIEIIIKQAIDINENNVVLNEIKKEMKNINKNESENKTDLIEGKLIQIEEFLKKSERENKNNINKMESLKTNLIRINDNIKTMKIEYKDLYEKYINNQQADINEDNERLVDENMMLSQENENKQQEIENLLEEKKIMKKDYQNIIMQYEDSIREQNELKQELSEFKINNYKLKSDYDKLLNDIMTKMDKDKKNKKNLKNDNNINTNYESQIKEIKSINNSKIDDGEKISRKKDIFNNMDNDKLINYVIEIERINQTLSNEKNNKDQKIHELTQKNVDLNNAMKKIKEINIDLEEEVKKLQKRIDNLNIEVKNNEMFRPSISSQMRISRLSKLNNPGINPQKYNITKSGLFTGKKNMEKFKLKDKNINQQINHVNTLNKFENISMDLYGVKEVEEEDDQENKKQEINNNNNNIEINKINQDNNFNINIEGKKNVNNMNISSNNGFDIKNQQIKKNKLNIGKLGQIDFGTKNKSDLEIGNNSSGMIFDGTNNDINLSSTPGIEIDLSQNINDINSDNNNMALEIGNINDINLSSNNDINKNNKSEGIFSSNIQFDVKNNNNNDNNKKNNLENNNNYVTQASGIFFESKPENNNQEIKNEEKSNSNSNLDDIPILKIDSLMGEMIGDEDKENKEKSKNNNNLKINEMQNNNNININGIKNENNININQIKNENNININNIKKNEPNNNNIERSRIDSVVINEKKDNPSQNLENIIITGIQKEGFNIENSSMQSSLSSSNSNNINLTGGNDIKNKNNNLIQDKNEIIINSSASSKNKNNNLIQDKNEIIINSSASSKNKNNILSISDKNEIKTEHISNDSNDDLFPSFNLSISTENNAVQLRRLSKVELDELRNNNYDYYSLFQEEYIQRKLKEEKDKANEFNIYSDQIFLLTEKKHLDKRYIVITPSHFYLIEPKEMRFTHVIKKENIISFHISNKNTNILMLQMNNSDNILIETLRRMDLLFYLKETYRINKCFLKIKYEDKFDIKIKGKKTTILIKDKIFSNLSNFDGAQKIGYLFVYVGTVIFPIFKEKLFVLTSIGLIMFDDTSSPPTRLYPIIGSTVVKLEGTKYNRENCFQVTLLSGKVKVFATRKKRERDSWLKEFDKINKEFQNKMKQLDTINKKLIGN